MKFTKENVIKVYGELLDYDEEMLENDDFVLSVEEMEEQPQLKENQETVLGWLKAYADKDSGEKPFQAIFFMWDCVRSQMLGQKEFESLRKLTRQEQFEVLQAFGQWGMEELGDE